MPIVRQVYGIRALTRSTAQTNRPTGLLGIRQPSLVLALAARGTGLIITDSDADSDPTI